jgi:hypothetical protein
MPGLTNEVDMEMPCRFWALLVPIWASMASVATSLGPTLGARCPIRLLGTRRAPHGGWRDDGGSRGRHQQRRGQMDRDWQNRRLSRRRRMTCASSKPGSTKQRAPNWRSSEPSSATVNPGCTRSSSAGYDRLGAAPPPRALPAGCSRRAEHPEVRRQAVVRAGTAAMNGHRQVNAVTEATSRRRRANRRSWLVRSAHPGRAAAPRPTCRCRIGHATSGRA